MSNVEAEEGWLDTPDGARLYTKTWKASTPKARLVFIHGFSDHCNTHDEPLFPTLVRQGITVYSFDQRGWGRSVQKPAQKGLTGPTKQVMEDITTFIKSLPTTESSLPLFLMGHSMGGQEVLMYAATGPSDVLSHIRGFLIESPFVALHPAARPWRLTVILGRLAGRLLPHMHMVNKLDPSKISRDPAVCKGYEEDPLCHDTGTLEGLAGMLDRAQELESGDVQVKDGAGEGGKTRIWVGHGTADQICDYQTCRTLFENLPVKDKEMRAYEGWYHKLHAEPGDDKHKFAQDVVAWVLARSASTDGDMSGGGERAKL